MPILDEFGCSFFPNVLPHVEYSEDLRGGLLVNAFSLDVDQASFKQPESPSRALMDFPVPHITLSSKGAKQIFGVGGSQIK